MIQIRNRLEWAFGELGGLDWHAIIFLLSVTCFRSSNKSGTLVDIKGFTFCSKYKWWRRPKRKARPCSFRRNARGWLPCLAGPKRKAIPTLDVCWKSKSTRSNLILWNFPYKLGPFFWESTFKILHIFIS